MIFKNYDWLCRHFLIFDRNGFDRCFQINKQMIIEQASVKYHKGHNSQHHKQRKQGKGFQGKRIVNQVAFNSVASKAGRNKIQTPAHHQYIQSDTFRDLLTKRDRHKQTQSKMESRFAKKHVEDSKSDKNLNNQNKSNSRSKSKSKSKGIMKSKSLKQLNKKSKSMVRLEVREKHHYQRITRQQRKSQSPNRQIKSIMSIVEKKNIKSNYVSKTNRQYTSELTTDRERFKGKIKITQTIKSQNRPKKQQYFKKKTVNKPVLNVIKKQTGAKKPLSSKQKKEKKVIISQQNSKVKRNECGQWQISVNDDQFLNPKEKKPIKQKKVKNKQSNMVQVPKRKQRLSLNTTNKRYTRQKNTKTQAQIEEDREKRKDIQTLAAITIQKVFRGYLTRKYIRECFQHNAAINIQRVWRGYRVRRQLFKNHYLYSSIPSNQEPIINQRKILEHQQYLLQRSSSREDSLKNSHAYNQKWASILQQILSEESVNESIKKKIELFLDRQRKEMNEFDYRSNRSASAKSSISNQIISNEINSQKHFMQNFIQMQKKKKQYPNMNVYISPTNYKSPKRFGYNSPQAYLMNSPQSFIHQKLNQSRQLNSSEMLVSNLKNIQKFHKERLQSKANSQKQELNKMLMKNKLSPRTHNKKYKEVEQILQNQLSKFNESINQIVKNCMLYKEGSIENQEGMEKNQKAFDGYINLDDENMITPKKEFVPLQIPFQMGEQCTNSQKLSQNDSQVLANLKKLDEKSQQFCQYYKFHKEELKKTPRQEAFDTSYQFVEEYLINLIDFLRQYEGGTYVSKILDFLRKPKSHEPQSIFNNMKIVTENSQEDAQNSFMLPMYKLIDLDQEIITAQLLQQFNETFPKLKKNETGIRNELEECFIKMIAQCMNEALNSLRPNLYLFTQTQLKTINTLKSMDKIPVFQSENVSEQQMQYQFMFAQALNKMFYWNKLEWGKIVNIKEEDEGERYQQMRQILKKQQSLTIAQLAAKEQWIFCQQLVQVIGILTQQLFSIIIYEEIAAIWTVFFDWNKKNQLKQSPVNLKVPSHKDFFQIN